jgi:telomere length regulation protein
MVVGMAISNLVEPTDKAMKFDLEEFETEEAEWYLGLTRIDDKMGSIKDLRDLAAEKGKLREPRQSVKSKVGKINRPSPTIQRERLKIVAIEEVSDDDIDMKEDEFIPYAKPDSDASDSEEDPTLVQRGKPTAPV